MGMSQGAGQTETERHAWTDLSLSDWSLSCDLELAVYFSFVPNPLGLRKNLFPALGGGGQERQATRPFSFC